MRIHNRWLFTMMIAILVIGISVPLASLRAQGNANAVTITLAVPNFNRDTFTDKLITDFETANPNIKVSIVKNDSIVPRVSGGLDKHLEAMQKYVAAADVVFIDPRRTPISPAATRAGFFLDLSPFANEDKTLNVDDFYPSIWQSYQWDKGLWALPTAADILLMSYDPAAFDKAGLAYPNEQWTLDDLVNAATKLTQKDASGAVTAGGLGVFPSGTEITLFRSMLNEGLFDPNSIPNPPQMSKPAVETLLTTWATLTQSGAIATGFGANAPISVGNGSLLLFFQQRGPNNTNNNNPRTVVLLPGGKAGITAQGYAVSKGTQYPEQAYAFVRFLTTRQEMLDRSSVSPARKSMTIGGGNSSGQGGQGGQDGGPGGGGPGGFGGRRNITPEIQAIIDKAVANGIPASELRYMDYLTVALQKMSAEKLDAKSALQLAETQAVADVKAADDKKPTITIAVATPIPSGALADGKVALKFGLASFVSPLPSQEKWDQLVKDFIASDPQVGRIVFDTNPGNGQVGNFSEQYDCFYMPYNAVPTTNLGLLLPIDPFITADSAFDKADYVGTVLTQVQRDNKTWGLPIVIQPAILKYNINDFTKANIPAPTSGWTITAFKDAVTALKPDPTLPPPFIASNTNGAHLLILMAAYGGLPLDYRTNPVTIDFTSQKSVDAIRQVLDLARQGYIKYDELANINFGGGPQNRDADIYTDVLNSFTLRQPINPTVNDAYKPAPYPKGSQSAAISYSIGTAYISAKSQNPEACYRFSQALAKHPEFFAGMPARRSLLNDPTATQGPDTQTLYKELDNLMKDPNTISLPSLFGGPGGGGMSAISGFLVQRWLYEAFDTYVLKGGDLDPALKQAETYAKTFQDCVAKIPPFDPATQNQRDYNRQFADCAIQADSRLKSLLGQ